MRAFRPVFFLLIPFLFAAGCTKPIDKSQPEAAPTQTEADAPQQADSRRALKLEVLVLVKQDENADPVMDHRVFESPTPELVSLQFNSLEWDNPLHTCMIGWYAIVEEPDNYFSFSIDGRVGSTDPADQLTATWDETPEGETMFETRFANGFESPQQTLDLLLAYQRGDENLQSMAAWQKE